MATILCTRPRAVPLAIGPIIIQKETRGKPHLAVASDCYWRQNNRQEMMILRNGPASNCKMRLLVFKAANMNTEEQDQSACLRSVI